MLSTDLSTGFKGLNPCISRTMVELSTENGCLIIIDLNYIYYLYLLLY